MQRFAHGEPFDQFGMPHVAMKMDETGTPVGALDTLTPVRDWTRFEEHFLQDGARQGDQSPRYDFAVPMPRWSR